MKLKITIFLLFTNFNLFSQSTNQDEIKYSADGIYISFLDDSGNEVNKVPIGKSPEITYNTFFKSFYITSIDENNQTKKLKLTYIMTNEDGLIRMSDTFGNIFYVANMMDYPPGKLIIVHNEKVKGYSVRTLIEGVEKK